MKNWTKPTRTCLPADLLICHEFRARLEDVRMITVDGDSTEPLLPSGCHILINVSTQSPVPTERRRMQILRSAVRTMADERVNSRWSEPFLVNPDELTPEQLARGAGQECCNAGVLPYRRPPRVYPPRAVPGGTQGPAPVPGGLNPQPT